MGLSGQRVSGSEARSVSASTDLLADEPVIFAMRADPEPIGGQLFEALPEPTRSSVLQGSFRGPE